jgi:polysaccharide biosynthesis protein PslG
MSRLALGSAQLVTSIRAALAAATVIVMLCGATPASANHLTDTGTPGGPTVPWGFHELWGIGSGTWSATLATQQLDAAGAITPSSMSANTFRVDWRDVEFTRDQYDWARTDHVYQAMQAGGDEPVMRILQAPEWARDPAATCPSSDPCAYPPAPQYDGEWEQFARDAVSRYPDVRSIEVWNEPNLGRFWAPAPSPQRYAEVLARAHDAAVAAGTGAPVITGGLSPVRTTNATRMSSREFLREIYKLGAAPNFEGIGTHPYPKTTPLVDDMWRELNRMLAVRDNQGDPGTPLWITEVGVSSDATEGVGLASQGGELVRLYRSIEGHDVESFVIYRFHDVTDESPYWNQTGVVNPDLTPKPAYCELGAAIGVPCPDTQAPETRIDSGPSGTTNASPSFTFSSSEPNSSFECVLDSGAWSPCTSPKSYQGLATGGHSFQVRATDLAGNTDPTPASRSFTVTRKGKK